MILKKFNELLLIPAGVLLFVAYPMLFKQTGEAGGAAFFDMGVNHLLFLAIAWFFVITGVIRVYLKLIHPYGDDVIEELFSKGISPWERRKLGLALFFGLLFAFIYLLKAITGA